ncbi:hypothetical protein [Thiothrix lacustris]|uniref:hypothetical protein n=1 Tax=Thiothrix lacustris TaxID=525917 RepID=UPI0027E59B99|nr:hypothetical protein [Thiothrix lacustris]WMP19497.1 hypothetical protein RCS87_19700 [Thiothrix lacustris]
MNRTMRRLACGSSVGDWVSTAPACNPAVAGRKVNSGGFEWLVWESLPDNDAIG